MLEILVGKTTRVCHASRETDLSMRSDRTFTPITVEKPAEEGEKASWKGSARKSITARGKLRQRNYSEQFRSGFAPRELT